MIALETYDTEQGLMVAAADESIVGELFEEGKVRVDVDEEFYGTTTAPREEVIERLRTASIANLVGEDAVEAGIEAEIIEEENVLRVSGVPHAQMVRL